MMVSQIDLSGIVIFLPLLSFLFVFIVVFVVLNKTKVIENKFIELLASFILATVFVSAIGPRNYVLSIIPWFAVLIVSLFLMLALIGFIGGDFAKSWSPMVGRGFAIFLIVIFIVSAIMVFSSYFEAYLPGGPSNFSEWAYSPRITGAFLLIVVGALVSWVLVRSK
ncbi:hypothetical protein KW787_00555 [Candidatus Pacearchaeota archaeon]|nr:hypothetical protein [Candidatus Pacearchaeota archaeon]